MIIGKLRRELSQSEKDLIAHGGFVYNDNCNVLIGALQLALGKTTVEIPIEDLEKHFGDGYHNTVVEFVRGEKTFIIRPVKVEEMKREVLCEGQENSVDPTTGKETKLNWKLTVDKPAHDYKHRVEESK